MRLLRAPLWALLAPRAAAWSPPSPPSRAAVGRTRGGALFVKVASGDDVVADGDPAGTREKYDAAAIEDARRRLQPHFAYPLDDWQLAAGAAILADKNVLVTAPTGAGKTAVGEMALRIALERDSRARYTTPLKALSNQKFAEMRRVFGADRVGLATGDVSIRRGADLTVCTTEVYRNMAWRSGTGASAPLATDADETAEDEVNDLSSNSIVVLDEFHYMGEKGRGSTWEESVIFNPPHTRIVGLSATLPNAGALAAWMEATTGRATVLVEADDARPVPLRYHFCTQRDFSPLFRDEEAGPGAPRGLLGLRGDGIVMAPTRSKKNKKGLGNTDGVPGLDGNGLPQGLSLHPTLQAAAEKTAASIDRRVQRLATRDAFGARDGYGRGRAISAREQRKTKERLLKQELRKSVPSVAKLVRRLEANDLLPSIFFIFSRKGCDNAAEILCDALKTKEEETATRRRRPAPEWKGRKGKPVNSKGRGRGRRRSTDDDADLSEEGLPMVQDEDGRNFRAELLDQLLSDELDAAVGREAVVGVEDESFLSEKNLRHLADIGLLDFDETKAVASRVSTFNRQNPEIAFSDATAEQLLCGIGSHHAGILPAHKAFAETLFRVGLMRVVFATETLAAGINMPARSTVIGSMAKRGDGGMALLETHNMLQMAGRAGRRGMDAEGHCVVAATPFETPDDAIAILTNEVKPIRSQFAPSYALAVNLVERGGGRLDASRSMVEKSFAVWERRQKEAELRAARDAAGRRDEGEGVAPAEGFLDALQLALEEELREAREGTSKTGTSKGKIARLTSLVDVLADGKKLKRMAKSYSGAARLLELEQSTVTYLERELRQMEEDDALGLGLPSDLLIGDQRSEITAQRRRVLKREREVNDNFVSTMAKVANNRIRDEADGALSKALLAVRLHEEASTFPEGAPLEPQELNAYIKSAPLRDRRSMLDQEPSGGNENESWAQMSALFKILECYGCLVPQHAEDAVEDEDNTRYRVTDGGGHVGGLGADNSLWQICALGGAWDVAHESRDLDQFRDALTEFEDDDVDQEFQVDETSDAPKPQQEAEALTSDLCQLSPAEMAGYVSMLVIDVPRNAPSAIESFQKLAYNQQVCVQGALSSLERMVEVQRKCGLDDAIGKCQLELSAASVVTAWASGCSWHEALDLSGAAPGDLVRTLSRALDALRQLGNVPYLPARAPDAAARAEARGLHPTIRLLCKEAANALDRYPVKDMLPFEEEDEDDAGEGEELEDDEASDEDEALTEERRYQGTAANQ